MDLLALRRDNYSNIFKGRFLLSVFSLSEVVHIMHLVHRAHRSRYNANAVKNHSLDALSRRFLGDAALRPADAEALAAALKPNTFLQARPGPVEQFGRNVKLHASMFRRSRKKGNILKTETLIYYVIKIWSLLRETASSQRR